MGLADEPRLYENQEGTAPTGEEQRMRVAIKGGAGPLSGINWKAHAKVVSGSNVTYTFYSDIEKTKLLATGVLIYSNASLSNLIGSEWSYP